MKYLYILISILSFSNLQAQFWYGSYGDPVLNIDFDTAPGYGSMLNPSSTDYTYSSSGPLGEGQYTIVSSSGELNDPSLHITTDHTGDINGDMMVFNSSSVTAEKILYTKKISGLCSGVKYQFSAWIMNLMNVTSPNPNVTFRISNSISGIVLSSINTGDIVAGASPEWMLYGFCFDVSSETDIDITILTSCASDNPGCTLALDDIIIKPCGPEIFATIEGMSDDMTYLYQCPINTKKDYTLIGHTRYNPVDTVINEQYSNPAYVWQFLAYDPRIAKNIWVDYGDNYSFTVSTYGSMYARYRVCIAENNPKIFWKPCRICSNVITFDFPYPPRSPNVEIIQPTCELPTGTITITTPIDPSYSYSIDRKNYQSSNVFSGLKPGNYSVTVKGKCDLISSTSARINTVTISDKIPTVEVIQPVSCTNPLGTITITSLDYEYSFDNGATWTTNNTKSGLVVGEYMVKTRNKLDCQTIAVPVSILLPADSPITPTVSVTQPDCLVQTGTIRVSDVSAEYSFDNGLTWTTSNYKSNLVAGKYKVLLKNTIGCVSYVSKEVEIKAYINKVPIPVAISPQQFCIQQNATFNDITISGTNIKWYDAAINGNLLAATTVLQNGTYYATQTVNTCESTRIPVVIKIQNTPAPTGVIFQDFCTSQKPVIGSLAATGKNLKWYNSATNGTVLSVTATLINGMTYYATQTVNGCESVNRLAVSVSIVSPTIVVNDVSDIYCDDKNDGLELKDLTSYQSQITSNSAVKFTYFKSLSGAENGTTTEQITTTKNYNLPLGTTIIYVRIESNDKCFQVVKMSLTLISKPQIPISDIVPICENKAVTINAGSGFDSYLWSTGATSESITVNTVGAYSVTVTQNNGNIICSSTKDFSVVLSKIATISEIKIRDWTDAENIITVEITDSSIGDYEYSLDGISYQTSNSFTGLRSGDYVVYVRDKNGCGITNQEVFVLSYPKYFTPNGDGYNDTWAVKFSKAEPNINIKIFDRYGKFIKDLNSESAWDGTYGGHQLPSSDYWFVVTRQNGKVFKGHFTLKR